MPLALHSLLRRQLKRCGVDPQKLPADCRAVLMAVNEAYRQSDEDRGLLEHSLELSSRELLRANSEMRAVFHAMPDVMLWLDAQGVVQDLKAGQGRGFAFSSRTAVGQALHALLEPRAKASFLTAWQAIGRGEPADSFEFSLTRDDIAVHFEARLLPLPDRQSVVFIRDVTGRRASELERDRLSRELAERSREAGKAEIATGVLHNVGNVLNSVNVSANLALDLLRGTKAAGIAKLAGLLHEHRDDLGGFFASDPKGRQVLPYLEALGHDLAQERAQITAELHALQASIDHVKQIVAMQQAYAKVAGVLESVAPCTLLEDALRLAASVLARGEVETVREFGAVPPVLVDRHKVLQILVNLINNARQAMEPRASGRRLVLRLAAAGGRVRIEVGDNGCGIPAENLARIFSHGFTTKKTGHGFGLHSCANAAKELGGALSVHSDGPGLGATFTLELPVPMEPDRALAA